MNVRVVDINALRALAPPPLRPVPRPSRPQPRTPHPRWSRRHSSEIQLDLGEMSREVWEAMRAWAIGGGRGGGR
jgi:hypothetical protein